MTKDKAKAIILSSLKQKVNSIKWEDLTSLNEDISIRRAQYIHAEIGSYWEISIGAALVKGESSAISVFARCHLYGDPKISAYTVISVESFIILLDEKEELTNRILKSAFQS